jgi:hypothetical protein
MTSYTTGHALDGYEFTARRPAPCMGCAYAIEPGARAYRLMETRDGDTVANDYHDGCQHGPQAVSA